MSSSSNRISMISSTTTLSKGKIHGWYNSSADASIDTAHAAKDKGHYTE